MSGKIFQFVPQARVQRSTFDLSHTRKLSAKIGELTPVYVQEVVPGDKFNIRTESFIRLAPLVSPIMHKLNSYIHYFFVPNRILWDGWEDFITGKVQGSVPLAPMRTVNVGSLADHIGVPPLDYNIGVLDVNALPFRAYTKIWNDYYRDQNLQAEIELGAATDLTYYQKACYKRAWEKDYFTSALNTPMAGSETDLAVDASVTYKNYTYIDSKDGAMNAGENLVVGTAVAGEGNFLKANTTQRNVRVDNIEEININVADIRRLTRLQRFLERSKRTGNRYFEHLLAHWGVMSKDARLQRAEYIGGGKTPILISEVANTTGTEDAPQGALAGNGISIGTENKASKFCDEHGWIIGIMSVLPESVYSQGVNRSLDRKVQLDYYFPEFAQLGEQEVKCQELYTSTNDNGENNRTWGYQSRFAEMKYGQNTVHGEFRKSLLHWHMGRNFAYLPELNESFIEADKVDDGIDPWRVFAVAGVEQMYVQLYHQVRATRPLPFLNDPTL